MMKRILFSCCSCLQPGTGAGIVGSYWQGRRRAAELADVFRKLQRQPYSTLSQITTDNVKNLELQWVLQVQQRGNSDKWEASPLVVDGVMYTVRPPNDVVAVDAVTGRLFWAYTHNPAQAARVCCGRVNRGLAILGKYPVHGNNRWATARDRRKERNAHVNVPVGAPEAVTRSPLRRWW
jgi:hypothetical protein